jgi:Arabinose efflux permease
MTVVNIALPHIQTSLHFSATSLSWVLSGYTLTSGGLLLLGGRAGDILGRRRMFLAGISLFTLASLAGGLATTPGVLLAARALQGVGGAFASPAVLALIVTSFPEGRERTRALGIYMGVITGGSSLGLVLGGVITEWLSWRWVLFINVPIGLAVIAVTPRFVAETPRLPGRFDLAGALTATVGRDRAGVRVHPGRGRRLGNHMALAAFGAAAVCSPCSWSPRPGPASRSPRCACSRRQPGGLVHRPAAAHRGHVRDVLLPHPVPAEDHGLQPAPGRGWRSCR